LLSPLNGVFAIGAGVLIGSSPAGDAIGWALLLAFSVNFCLFIHAQRSTARAIGAWMGSDRMRWLPRMTPERFEEWRKLRGLRAPGERLTEPAHVPEGTSRIA
jgi:hypothetical protein